MSEPYSIPPMSRRRRGKGLVLVIDDSRASVSHTQEMLEEAGYSVTTASNGIEGIRAAYREIPDLIVCDVVMPEINGYQLCRLAKNDAAIAHIPIILLTSLAEERDRFWGTKAGADRYVVKRDAEETLLSAVGDLIASSHLGGHYSGTMFYVSATEMDESAIKSKVSFLLDKLLFEQTLVNEARKLAAWVHQRDRLVAELVKLLMRLVNYDRLALLLREQFTTSLYVSAPAGSSPASRKRMLELAVRELGEMRALDQAQIILLAPETSPSRSGEDPPRDDCVLVYPITHEKEVLGVIVLERQSEAFNQPVTAMLRLLMRDVALVVKLLYLYEESRWLSVTDSLTKVYNRRYFMDIFQQQFEQFQRYRTPCSLLFLDIDNFKLVNDTYGHNTGDVVLQQTADILRRSIRKVDLLSRFGGEEFTVLLPQTTVANAVILAKRIRAEIEQFPYGSTSDPMHVTASLGVAELDETTRSALDLLDRADHAMLNAKAKGKNRVELSRVP
jgi:two-component system cell cycle response regulator